MVAQISINCLNIINHCFYQKKMKFLQVWMKYFLRFILVYASFVIG